ncbi:hypothetical protein [Clostridium akagii]|uniref:hypothetical protein n=1 Tax=Clostridium akagii TaxID=91623 RepID=UPI00047B4DE5|nr:hypothetical protein [Clostridium akagii]
MLTKQREFIKQETWIEKRIIDTATEISILGAEIDEKESDLNNIELGMKRAIGQYKEKETILQMRYRDYRTYEQIAKEIRSSKSNVEKILKTKILYEISKWVRNTKELEEKKS